jgi:hypothetical protein
LNTVTCAGHATIATGTFPHTHGMVLNAWWDRGRRALTTCTDDASSPAISYGPRTPATASGRQFRAPTFAVVLRAERPGSRVVSLSLKPRSAISLAGRGGTERVEETLVTRFGAAGKPRDGYVANVTFTNVYLADGVWNRLGADDDAWRSVESAVTAIPGVARLLRADRLDPRSNDVDVRAAALSFTADRSGDLIVVTRPHWTVGPRAESSATTHGTGHPYDRHVPLMLLGGAVRPRRIPGPVSPADIAPTFAHVAGVTMNRVEGRVLKEALRETTVESDLSRRQSDTQ